MRIKILLLLVLTVLQTTAQDVLKTESEINRFIQSGNWDQVMMRSLDLMTAEPLQPQGYYYTALVLCHQTEFAKAEMYNKKAFLFGDAQWRSKTRSLSKQISELKKLIPQPVDLENINSLEPLQWQRFWEMDKSNLDAGINAVELYVKKNKLVEAASILDDPAMSAIPGAGALRKKLSGNKSVAGADKLETLVKAAETYTARKEFESAKSAYLKAIELDKNNYTLKDKLELIEDEIAWKTAQNKNTVEGYETYLNRGTYRKYQDPARAKIIDYLKEQIEIYAKRNEIDQAEAAYTKYVQRYRPNSAEKQQLEKVLCDLYFNAIYSLSGSKEKADKKARLDLYYKARKICELSEADKKEISKLEKSLN